MNNNRFLILASGSPQRRKLLEQADYRFLVSPPDDAAECGVCSTGGPVQLVAELATRKALDVVPRFVDGEIDDGRVEWPLAVVGCDTVAECGGEALGKPRDEEHARWMLQRLRGTRHRVLSGLCICFCDRWGDPPSVSVRTAVSELEMDRVSEQRLDDYMASGLWREKAGALGYQDPHCADWLHLRTGSESNVIGLPLELLAEMIADRARL